MVENFLLHSLQTAKDRAMIFDTLMELYVLCHLTENVDQPEVPMGSWKQKTA